MTVRDLKKALEDAHDDMDVFINQTDTEYPMSLMVVAEIKRIPFYDNSNTRLRGEDDVFLITD